MLDQLEKIEKRYQELNQQIAMPEVTSDPKQLQTLARERARIETLVTKYREHKAASKTLEETRAMLDGKLDEEMAALVKQEIASLESQLDRLLQELKLDLLPKEPNDKKNVIVEIRAGAGGNEAGLFAADLFRMYSRYAQSKGWEIDMIDSNESGIGGFNESTTFGLDGRIAEIPIYNRSLTALEITKVNSYLSKKWGTP